jgi:Protein of unknown function (DUF2442)
MTSSAQSRRSAAIAVSDTQIDAAYRRHQERLAREPLAVQVQYDRVRDTVVVRMNNGAELVIPRHLLQGLRDATADNLRGGEVTEGGTVLTWPALDADFTVLSLLRGIYGGRRWMSELARHAGATTSEAKAAAARANGRKGGRPPKKPSVPSRTASRKR